MCTFKGPSLQENLQSLIIYDEKKMLKKVTPSCSLFQFSELCQVQPVRQAVDLLVQILYGGVELIIG
jgi:hypothetical protein